MIVDDRITTYLHSLEMPDIPVIEEIEKEGLTLMHLRNVPTCPEILGEAALANEPDIKQIFITGFTDSETADRRLYIIRKRIENRIRQSDIA